VQVQVLSLALPYSIRTCGDCRKSFCFREFKISGKSVAAIGLRGVCIAALKIFQNRWEEGIVSDLPLPNRVTGAFGGSRAKARKKGRVERA
jgi:hypothetical protein